MYIINTDASIAPYNPSGILAWAFIAKLKGRIVHKDVKIHGWGEGMTNNLGEYLAVVGAMLWLLELPKERQYPVCLFSDSQLVVNQCSKLWKVSESTLVELNRLVLAACKKYPRNITFKWTPREKNKEADALSRSLYTEKALQLMKDRQAEIIFGDDDITF